MTRISRYLPVMALALFASPFARAQSSSIDLGIGFGTFHDKSGNFGIDNTTLGGCVPGSAPTCETTSGLGNFFMGFGGRVLFAKHYGFGGEVAFQPGKQSYGPLDSRTLFFDADGIYAPVNEKRVSVQVLGGLGVAHTGFSITQTSCVGNNIGCQTQSGTIASANHFQLHAGVGVQIYVTEHIFIRPQFDYHFVPNMTNEFGSNSVPGGTIWIGYSFARQ